MSATPDGTVDPRRGLHDLPEDALVPVEPDETFDRFARLVRAQLGVPVSLVSIVTRTGQVFPGASGLPDPVQDSRWTPLVQSVCQHVVLSGGPVLAADIRTVPSLAGGAAFTELGVVAYAGFPVRDADGTVVGALCAIDSEPREWTERDGRVMEDLAAACSAELALLQLRERALAARQGLQEALLAAEASEHRAVASRRTARLLLALSESLADTTTVGEIIEVLSPLAMTGLGAEHAGIALVDADHRRHTYLTVDDLPTRVRQAWRDAALDASSPTGAAVLSGHAGYYRDLVALRAAFPGLRPSTLVPLTGARAVVPLHVGGEALGALVLAWQVPRSFDADAQAVIAALARYTAQAVSRARLLEQRRGVARTLQEALLTDLPQPVHLQLAARYVPASDGEQVGGDWYDVVALPDGGTALVIGDVTGHDMAAAATMGQLRSMTRTLAWSYREPPSAVLRRLDDAVAGLGMQVSATAVLARLDGPRLTWSNAGHLPPLLLAPDGTAALLRGRSNLLLGIDPDARRSDLVRDLQPGSTLLLFSDGLVERRDSPLMDDLQRLLAFVAARATLTTEGLADALVTEMAGPHPADDVALLVVRLPVDPAGAEGGR